MENKDIIYYTIKEGKLEEIKDTILPQNLKELCKKVTDKTNELIIYIEQFAKDNKIFLHRGRLTQKAIYQIDKELIKTINLLINARVSNNKAIKRLNGILHDPVSLMICEKCGGGMERIPLNCNYIKSGKSYILLGLCSEWLIACKECPFAYNENLLPSHY